jgi:hypothetical protein
LGGFSFSEDLEPWKAGSGRIRVRPKKPPASTQERSMQSRSLEPLELPRSNEPVEPPNTSTIALTETKPSSSHLYNSFYPIFFLIAPGKIASIPINWGQMGVIMQKIHKYDKKWLSWG